METACATPTPQGRSIHVERIPEEIPLEIPKCMKVEIPLD
jgi:hypothetical protein